MSKLIIIFLISLQIILACHQSCNCNQGSNVCISCKNADIGSVMDAQKRSCPCPPGWYNSSLEPYVCTKFPGTNENGQDESTILSACKYEIGLKTKDIKIGTDCHFENTQDRSIVVSQVTLIFNQVSMSDECKAAYVTKVQYVNPLTNKYQDLDQKYITVGDNGSKTLTWPLIDMFNFATEQYVGDEQITQKVQLQIIIGHSDSVIRIHKWNLFIFTNRNQVETFQLDVTVQETEGCQPGQECIIVADLDTQSQIYKDATFNTVHNGPYSYKVGDIFYAKIKFTDPTYTKQLKLKTLYFKDDLGKIFNFSSITTSNWSNGGLQISLPLVQPTIKAVIQVNMQIMPISGRRHLQNSDTKTVSSKFSVTILSNGSPNVTDNSNQNNSNSNSGIILLNLINLIVLFILTLF